MALLFSKVDSSKLYDVQNEATLICAKFGKDLFNIPKVTGIGCKTNWPRFWPTIRYDTIEEFNVDSKAEYTAYYYNLYNTRSQKLKQMQCHFN